jgi:hypothetical protein
MVPVRGGDPRGSRNPPGNRGSALPAKPAAAWRIRPRLRRPGPPGESRTSLPARELRHDRVRGPGNGPESSEARASTEARADEPEPSGPVVRFGPVGAPKVDGAGSVLQRHADAPPRLRVSSRPSSSAWGAVPFEGPSSPPGTLRVAPGPLQLGEATRKPHRLRVSESIRLHEASGRVLFPGTAQRAISAPGASAIGMGDSRGATTYCGAPDSHPAN